MLSEPVAVTLQIIDALESIGVPYLIGGSFASAVHGRSRHPGFTDMQGRVLSVQAITLQNLITLCGL